MDNINDSVVSEFVLLGLSSSSEMKVFLTLIFSLLYVCIILGNLFILFLVIFDANLHSPMYFLLANLSLIDVGFSSTTVPKMIIDLLREHKVISFQDCMAQICLIHITGGVEMVLLIAMAFDRYTAICKPLHYLKIMSPKMCVSFVVIAWVTGVIHALSQFIFIIHLPFCGPNEIDSFYCDFPRIIKLACTDGAKYEFIVAANSGFMTMGAFFLLILSYVFILVTVWKCSSGDLSKAFVTLSAHITVVVLYFTPCMFLYVWHFSTSSLDKYLFIVDFAITPVLNPAIYTLRNKDMKTAMKKSIKQAYYAQFCLPKLSLEF
ncbi:olfactory receptor 4F21-like [Tamandua tetradactyla]|uniref:olfactory receptor 4F21-like n=1 Tax=Tamandua tetradactyla TaxID=48850 RepID=UPI0040544FE9